MLVPNDWVALQYTPLPISFVGVLADASIVLPGPSVLGVKLVGRKGLSKKLGRPQCGFAERRFPLLTCTGAILPQDCSSQAL